MERPAACCVRLCAKKEKAAQCSRWDSGKPTWCTNGDPLKDKIVIGAGAGPAFADGPRQVIGIVGDKHDGGPNRAPLPMMYIPLAQMPDLETALNSRAAPMGWIVRTQVSPRTLVNSMTAALREGSGGLPVAHIRTMEEIEARNIAGQRFNMVLLTVLGSAALLMAAIGIYGVLSYSVEQRTQELGAHGGGSAGLESPQHGDQARHGAHADRRVVLGSRGALWLKHFLKSFRFGVTALDPISFFVTPLLLIGVALISVWGPAVRATRVDPMTALRIE